MIIDSDAEMRRYGASLSRELHAGNWLAIDGPLGAGKTVLCAGILQGLGFTGEVNSPSYAIINHYDPPVVGIRVIHADLYRLNNREELEELGLDQDNDDCITLVEWAMNAGPHFGNPSHFISIELLANGSRQLEIKIADHE